MTLAWLATITPLGGPEDAALLTIQTADNVAFQTYDTTELARTALIDMEERTYAAWQESIGA